MLKEVTRRLCAKIIGFVFFIAGTLKLMDPVGTSLIIKEYLNFLHLGFLSGISMVAGEGFALIETFCGICLVTGVFRKVTAWAVSILLGGFTLLTLVLWIFNPSMDCGCFGEAIHLSHFQSFAKNIILCALAAAEFIPFGDYGKPSKKKYTTFGLIGAASLLFALYSLIYIPMLELTPFNLSSRLAAAAEVPDIEEDEYISTFIYEKNGKRGVFTLNKLPDSTWTFVETKTIKKEDNIVETGYPELSFRDIDGNYRDTLAVKGNVLVFSINRPERIRTRKWNEINNTVIAAGEAGFSTLLLTAGDYETMARSLSRAGVSEEFSRELAKRSYIADYRTLISLNRSNGGAVYFNDGNLIEKWAAAAYPESKELGRLIRQDSTEVMLKADSKGRLSFQAYMLYTLSILLLI